MSKYSLFYNGDLYYDTVNVKCSPTPVTEEDIVTYSSSTKVVSNVFSVVASKSSVVVIPSGVG